MIKEYKDSKGYIQTECQIDEYTVILRDYFFVEIHQKSLKMVWFNTSSSRESIKFFSTPMKESDYKDFGDCFETFKDGIWSVYSKPHSKHHPELSSGDNLKGQEWWNHQIPLYKKLGELIIRMDEKYFPQIVKFIEENQQEFITREEIEEHYEMRQRLFKIKERENKLNRIM